MHKYKVVYINPEELKAGLERLLHERDAYREALVKITRADQLGEAQDIALLAIH